MFFPSEDKNTSLQFLCWFFGTLSISRQIYKSSFPLSNLHPGSVPILILLPFKGDIHEVASCYEWLPLIRNADSLGKHNAFYTLPHLNRLKDDDDDDPQR